MEMGLSHVHVAASFLHNDIAMVENVHFSYNVLFHDRGGGREDGKKRMSRRNVVQFFVPSIWYLIANVRIETV